MNVLTAALSALFVLVPLAFWPALYQYELLPKLLVFYVCGGLFALTVWRSGRTPLLVFPALSWAVAVLLSGALGPDMGYVGVSEVGFQLSLVAFAMCVSCLSPGELLPVWWCAALTGAVLALLGILQYHGVRLGIPQSAPPAATFGNRNFLAQYLVCCIPVALWLNRKAKSRWAVLLTGNSMALMGMCLIFTQCRGAWIGLAAGFCAIHRYFVVALCLVLALSFFTSKPLSHVQDRMTFWKASLRMICDHPVFGVGPACWVREFPRYDPAPHYRNPHNDYLWIASEYGLVGLAAWIWILVWTIRRLWRMPDCGRFLCASLIALSVSALVGFPREQPDTMIWMWSFVGIAAGEKRGEKACEIERKSWKQPFVPHLKWGC